MEVVGEYPLQPGRTSFVSTPSGPISSPFSSPCREGAMDRRHGSSATVPVIPFKWEERPGLPKSYLRSLSNRSARGGGRETSEQAAAAGDMEDGSLDFAFEFRGLRAVDSSEDDAQTTYADELFDSSGWIRSHGQGIRSREDDTDRGRSRTIPLASGSRRRTTRSLPPLGRAAARDPSCDATSTAVVTGSSTAAGGANYNTSGGITTTVATITGYVKGGIMRWGRENLLLFRSASEGRASSSGAKARFASMASSMLLLDQEVKRGSFRIRSVDEVGRRATRTSLGGSSRHGPSQEMALYARSRAVDHELGKHRTFLPYRQGLLGFNPAFRGPSSMASGPRQSY